MGLHKGIDKKKLQEFQNKLKDINNDFIRFQIEHKARAFINNQYQFNEEYPRNVLIDLICSFNSLNWRPMEDDEALELQKKLVESAGIVLPK